MALHLCPTGPESSAAGMGGGEGRPEGEALADSAGDPRPEGRPGTMGRPRACRKAQSAWAGGRRRAAQATLRGSSGCVGPGSGMADGGLVDRRCNRGSGSGSVRSGCELGSVGSGAAVRGPGGLRGPAEAEGSPGLRWADPGRAARPDLRGLVGGEAREEALADSAGHPRPEGRQGSDGQTRGVPPGSICVGR